MIIQRGPWRKLTFGWCEWDGAELVCGRVIWGWLPLTGIKGIWLGIGGWVARVWGLLGGYPVEGLIFLSSVSSDGILFR